MKTKPNKVRPAVDVRVGLEIRDNDPRCAETGRERTGAIVQVDAMHVRVKWTQTGRVSVVRRDRIFAAAENLKRVVKPGDEDWTQTPGLARMLTYLETKTVWHPAGT